MKKNSNIQVVLDLGTSEFKALAFAHSSVKVSQHNFNQDIIASSRLPSCGVRKGVIVHLEHAAAQVKNLLSEIEREISDEVSEVICVLSGSHLYGCNHNASVVVRHGEVSKGDIDRVLESTRKIDNSGERELLHVIPQEFVVDDQDGIRDPLGMAGNCLEARVHLVTGLASFARNIVKCVNLSGRMVRDFVVGGLASARAVTSNEERELGVLVLDIGGGTTDISVISRGVLCHLAVSSLGGGHLTFDLAAGLRTPIVAAERLKCSHGAALAQTVHLDDVVEVASIGVRPPRLVSRKTLVQLLEPRVRELFEIVKAEMVGSELLKIAHAGVVLCGGGAQLIGIDSVAEDILGLPVRIGSFSEISSSSENVFNPVFSACVGAGLVAGSTPGFQSIPTRAYSSFTNAKAVPLTKWMRHIGDWLGQHF